MITVIHKETHHVENLGKVVHVGLTQTSIVLVDGLWSPELRIRRSGTFVIIEHPRLSHKTIQIQDFFSPDMPTDHSLVFLDSQRHCIWLRFTNDSGAFLSRPKPTRIHCYSELLYLLDTDQAVALFMHNTAVYDFHELYLNAQLPTDAELQKLRA